jgi:hypothetical protein
MTKEEKKLKVPEQTTWAYDFLGRRPKKMEHQLSGVPKMTQPKAVFGNELNLRK